MKREGRGKARRGEVRRGERNEENRPNIEKYHPDPTAAEISYIVRSFIPVLAEAPVARPNGFQMPRYDLTVAIPRRQQTAKISKC
jgi:hypothetical protein